MVVDKLQKLTTKKIKEKRNEITEICNILKKITETHRRPMQYTGTVEDYFPDRKFGFVKVDFGYKSESALAHYNSIIDDVDDKRLLRGRQVKFDLVRRGDEKDQKLSITRVHPVE
jgi:cold shock CspA family protein